MKQVRTTYFRINQIKIIYFGCDFCAFFLKRRIVENGDENQFLTIIFFSVFHVNFPMTFLDTNVRNSKCVVTVRRIFFYIRLFTPSADHQLNFLRYGLFSFWSCDTATFTRTAAKARSVWSTYAHKHRLRSGCAEENRVVSETTTGNGAHTHRQHMHMYQTIQWNSAARE